VAHGGALGGRPSSRLAVRQSNPLARHPLGGCDVRHKSADSFVLPQVADQALRSAADCGEYRQVAGANAEAVAFIEDGASGTEPTHGVPAEAGTWDWTRRTRQSLSRWPSTVRTLPTRNSRRRRRLLLQNYNRRTMDSFAPQRVLQRRR
jgi:hypothetical protein